MGYTGLISLGHSAFFGVGGYTVAILVVKFGINSFWITAPAAILMAAVVAVLAGFIALRVSGIYFLLVTFALSMLLVSVATKWYSLTGGSDGLPNIPYPELGLPWLAMDTTQFYYFVCLFFILCFFLIYRIVNSPFGYALRGIRESESRMRALGYDTWAYKYTAFIISGLFAGVAGALTASYNGVIAPWHLDVTVSSLALLICIIGGLGTLWGPLIGALVIIFVEYFSSLYAPERWPLVLGGTFILTVMFLENGIAPQLQKFWRRMLSGNAAS
jgi:branched-chain amino acid transport system permease protein